MNSSTTRKTIDFKQLADALLSDARELVPRWLSGGTLAGNEWTCGDVYGNPGKSCKANLETGKWADFSADQKGGDLISLYAANQNLTQIEAARKLAESYSSNISHPRASRVYKKTDSDIITPPTSAPKPDFKTAHGTPTDLYPYCNLNGELQFYIARYEPANNKKQFIPWSWSKSKQKWIMKIQSEDRPLYGLIDIQPDKPILIVEGEKSVHAARQICGKAYSVVSWQGGAQAIYKTDWRPVFGRKILIWPDGDSPGIAAATAISELLNDNCPEIKFIRPDRNSGWDAADAAAEGFNYAKFIEWAKPLASIFEPAKDVELIVTKQDEFTKQLDLSRIVANLPHKTEKGRIKGTFENLKQYMDELGVVIRYNVQRKTEEILIPGEHFSIDNAANASLAWAVSWCAKIEMPTSNVISYLLYLADKNQFNPVMTWVNSKPWDGISRLEDLYSTVGAKFENTDSTILERKKNYIKKWMISAIAAAASPVGVSAHGVLVFQGEQNLGKTSWLKSLVPKDLNLIMEACILQPNSRDSVRQTCSFWLVELGELDATIKKSDMAQLKGFLTKSSDVLRNSYAAKDSQYARRTVFFASVNPREFLNDPTGNRRFWTIECDSINFQHGLDMQQIWAEVNNMYEKGEPYYLSKDEVNNLNNDNEIFSKSDPIEELIASKFKWDSEPTSWKWIAASEALRCAGVMHPTPGETSKASMFIQKKSGYHKKRFADGNRVLVPEVLMDSKVYSYDASQVHQKSSMIPNTFDTSV